MSKFKCPKCGLALEQDDGTAFQCPGCQTTLAVGPDKGQERAERADDLLESWQGECEKAVRMLSNLLTLAGRQSRHAPVIEMLRSVPRSAVEVSKLPVDSLLARCVADAFERRTDSNARTFEEIAEYLKYLTEMRPCRRALLEASVAGVFLGWAMAE